MRRKRRDAFAALAGIIALGIVVYLWPPSEPKYHGKPLSYWLKGYSRGPMPMLSRVAGAPTVTRRMDYKPSAYQADRAIDAMGTNAIPALLRMLRYREPQLKRSVETFLIRKFPALGIQPGFPNEPVYEASMAFQELWTNAAPAVPQLIAIYKSNPDDWSYCVPEILSYIGPPARQAVPMLLEATTNKSQSVRVCAIAALGRIGSDPARVVPVLIRCLRDPDYSVRFSAVQALSDFGPDAKLAVPALLVFARDKGNSTPPFTAQAFGPVDVRAYVKSAITEIDPEAARKLGLLLP